MIDRWELTGTPGHHGRWQGVIPNGIEVTLFGPEKMGRVPAAVATSRLLADDSDYALVIVAGLAGGFTESGVDVGMVLVPSVVADLAVRKVGGDAGHVRPEPYNLDKRIARYIDNQPWGQSDWERAVRRNADIPETVRPFVKTHGTIASVDIVVADDDERRRLLQSWPKMLGVEMESGGVIAAGDSFEMNVAVVRAVSDKADPSKADDRWRRNGMVSIALLLEAIDWPILLDMQGR